MGNVKMGDTIAGHYCERNFLKLIIREINKQITGTQNFKFLHDNARPYVTLNVTGCHNRVGITIICHPMYSAD